MYVYNKTSFRDNETKTRWIVNINITPHARLCWGMDEKSASVTPNDLIF